jgi:hypothetical protein
MKGAGAQKLTCWSGNRFIPNREGVDLATSYKLIPNATTPSTPWSKGKRRSNIVESDAQKGSYPHSSSCYPSLVNVFPSPASDEADRTLDALLRTELFGPDFVDPASLRHSPSTRKSHPTPSSSHGTSVRVDSPVTTPSSKPLFSFSSPSRKRAIPGERERVVGLDSPTHERYSVSPVKYESQKLLLSPRKAPRLLSKVPFKVLDAPELAVSLEAKACLQPRAGVLMRRDLRRTTTTSISLTGRVQTSLPSGWEPASTSGAPSPPKLRSCAISANRLRLTRSLVSAGSRRHGVFSFPFQIFL